MSTTLLLPSDAGSSTDDRKTDRSIALSLTGPAVALAVVVVVFLLSTAGRYGFFRDELYYLASIDHLDWGYVDHPPLSIALLAAWTAVLGDGLLAVRLLPALLAGAIVLLTAHLAGILGGGRRAVVLASAATASAPIVLHMGSFFSMNVLDILLWTLAAIVVVRLQRTDDARGWIVFGAVVGIGLLNKLSIGFFASGVAVAVVATPLRRHLRRWQLWAGAALAATLFAPHLVWQHRHGWPTLEFIAEARRVKIADLGMLEKLGQLVVLAQPAAAALMLLGFGWTLLAPRAAASRWIAVASGAVAIFLLLQQSKPYYLAPLFPLLFAAGSVALADLTRRRFQSTPLVVAVLLLLGGAVLAPLVVPVLPPGDLVAYRARLGIETSAAENHVQGILPQHFADRFGWPELAERVAVAWRSLPESERATSLIVAANYGEAGALRRFGPALGLPPAASQHNSFYLWGPGRDLGRITTVLAVGIAPDALRESFADVRSAGTVEHPWAMPYETGALLWWAREPTRPLGEAWAAGRHYD